MIGANILDFFHSIIHSIESNIMQISITEHFMQMYANEPSPLICCSNKSSLSSIRSCCAMMWTNRFCRHCASGFTSTVSMETSVSTSPPLLVPPPPPASGDEVAWKTDDLFREFSITPSCFQLSTFLQYFLDLKNSLSISKGNNSSCLPKCLFI